MNRRELMQLAALAGTAAVTTSIAAQTKPATTRIQMLVYPGMTLQDLVGPLQVWASWPGAQIQFAWQSTGPVPTDSSLAVVATTSFADAWATPDILFAPGGLLPTFELLEDAAVIEFLRSRGEQAKWVTSVCTGALLLHEAGFAKGKRVTTHWTFVEPLRARGDVTVLDGPRYVRDGNLVTAAGVSAGIDMALWLVGQLHSPEVARRVQRYIQYDPAPPYAAEV